MTQDTDHDATLPAHVARLCERLNDRTKVSQETEEEAAALLPSMAAEVERLLWANGYASQRLEAAETERDRIKAALEKLAARRPKGCGCDGYELCGYHRKHSGPPPQDKELTIILAALNPAKPEQEGGR